MDSAPVILLETKLQRPPVRADLVARPRLLAMLDQAVAHPLTVVSAPAGSGKTTLVADWCSGIEPGGTTVSWLSLDTAEDDPVLFKHYLVAALERAGVELTQLGASVRADASLPLEIVVASLINELDGHPSDVVLVLDDFHVITCPEVQGAVRTLAVHAPPPLHLVVSSRTEPPLGLPALRARGRLHEINGEDLRFEPGESRTLLSLVTQREVDPAEAELIERQTEGWAAGLQLVALSARGLSDESRRAGPTFRRFAFDYLADEVFDGLDEATRRFLVRTSILTRLTGGLCDAVTGEQGGAARLADLYRRNLFTVALDEQDEWLRYHHLFRDFLRQRLDEIRPDERAAMHRAASQWLRMNGFVDEAIEHATEAGDLDAVRELIEDALPSIVARNDFATAERWLAELTSQDIARRPAVGLSVARMRVMQGRLADASEILDQAQIMLDDGGASPAFDRVGLQAMAANTKASVLRFHGDLAGAERVSDDALAELPGERRQERAWLLHSRALARFDQGDAQMVRELPALAEQCLAAGHPSGFVAAQYMLATSRLLKGNPRDAMALAEEALARLAGADRTPAAALLHTVLALGSYELDDLSAAETHLRSAFAADTPLSYSGTTTPPDVVAAQIALARGNRDEAMAVILRLESRLSLTESHQALTRIPMFIARLHLLLGDRVEAARWAATCGLDLDGEPSMRTEDQYLTLARILIADQRPSEALPMLARLETTASAAGRFGRVVEVRVAEALALEAMRERAGALRALVEALRLGAASGLVRTIVDGGPEIIPLLRAAAAQRRGDEYAAHLLERHADSAQRTSDARLVEPLSNRELDVLHLLSSGCSNGEIAKELVVSLATVKTHVQNIFGKLEVHTRTQAVARARELRLE